MGILRAKGFESERGRSDGFTNFLGEGFSKFARSATIQAIENGTIHSSRVGTLENVSREPFWQQGAGSHARLHHLSTRGRGLAWLRGLAYRHGTPWGLL